MTTEQNKCRHEFNEETGYCINCFDNVHSAREVTTEQKNREVAEWLGIVPYISPGGHERYDFPDFSCGAGIIRLLELIMKREDWLMFKWKIGGNAKLGSTTITYHEFEYIDISYITAPGKLLQAVWEWSKEHPR